ncbi:MAG: SpoIIIAH-like family protein [Lachnospiraceae bacterium]|nr:SpoIIIAH-like family protein [Lachnospiraceae bacterium]MBQ6857336.1 SpoIIIAH-like family protein [Lachnospiraceae bacterium]
MKRIFRRNQIIITTLAVMIAAAGYMNYSVKKEVVGAEVYEAGVMEISDEDLLAENQISDPATVEDLEISIDSPGEAVLTSGTSVSEYIAGVQLGREQVRAKNKETLMEMIGSDQIAEADKQAVIQSMIRMTEVAEKENAAETLLQAKGFVDPVVSITDGKVDVVINATSITDPERAQIEDIVKRKTEVEADGIVITLMELAE